MYCYTHFGGRSYSGELPTYTNHLGDHVCSACFRVLAAHPVLPAGAIQLASGDVGQFIRDAIAECRALLMQLDAAKEPALDEATRAGLLRRMAELHAWRSRFEAIVEYVREHNLSAPHFTQDHIRAFNLTRFNFI